MDKLKNLVTGSDMVQAINPFTGEALEAHKYISDGDLEKKIKESWDSFERFRKTDPKERAQKFRKLADILSSDTDRFARTITMEMGKPIHESRREVSAAMKECMYYADHMEELLKPEELKTKAKRSFVLIQPLGPIYHITPCSFPFSLLFRSTIASMAMGNTVINKNPHTCPQSGINAEEAFREAGFTNGEFMNLIISDNQSELILKDKHIRGVSFTGSPEAGSKVAALAGKYSKKSVMELGGNDAFIVCRDADLDLAVEQGIKGRLMNGGQSSTAAKRFIVDQTIYEDYKNRLIQQVKQVKVGDPMEEDTIVGPLSKKSSLDKIMDQVKRAKAKGGKVLLGDEQPKGEKLKKGMFYMPTIIEVTEENPLFWEETFGPVFVLLKAKDEKDAIRLANKSQYGLGGAVFSKDEKRAEHIASELETGSVSINRKLSWSSEAPEGGIKESGYGRESGRQGAYEFVNFKTIWIAK